MGLLDDWWKLNPNAGGNVYNVQPGGTFTTMFGQPAPNEDNIPQAPVGTPRISEILTPTPTPDPRTVPPPTPKVPEILTGPRDERTVPPPAAPPTSSKVPEVLTPIAPSTPGGPTADPRLIPTAASTAAQTGNIWDEWMKRVKDPKFGPAIAALAKGMGSGAKAPEAHQAPFPRLDPAPNISGQLGGIASQAGQAMGDIRKKLAVFGPKPKKQRTDDPHDREQDTYDFRRLKRSM